MDVVTLRNSKGHTVELSPLGAGILSVNVPDREGKVENVALSYSDPADYMNDGPCLGKTPGRYANRIARGHIVIDGKTYKLPVNNVPNHLHGGPEGFQNKYWKVKDVTENSVCFTLESPDGEMGYPGNLKASVTYHWSDDDSLSITYEATTDASTVINLTNHTYWNLDGADAGSALDHELRIRADRYLPTDDTLIPLPEAPATVADTPMDFREFERVGERIREDFPALNYGKGYDACWCLDALAQSMSVAALQLKSSRSGRLLEVFTDQPGAQVYTGNWLAGSPRNRSGRSYDDYDGIAIEAQGYPDAPNRPGFPSQILRPGDTYRRRIIYRFSTI